MALQVSQVCHRPRKVVWKRDLTILISTFTGRKPPRALIKRSALLVAREGPQDSAMKAHLPELGKGILHEDRADTRPPLLGMDRDRVEFAESLDLWIAAGSDSDKANDTCRCKGHTPASRSVAQVRCPTGPLFGVQSSSRHEPDKPPVP